MGRPETNRSPISASRLVPIRQEMVLPQASSAQNAVRRRARSTVHAGARAEIAQLEKTIGEVKSIKDDKKALEDKLRILDTLKKGRTGPVKVLDELASLIPEKVWLLDFTEQAGGVSMVGQASSYEDLSTFSKKLKASTHLLNITIKGARQRADGTVDWTITCTANYSA